jgi:endonuclease YncB( thermonuclease family)
MGLFRFLARLFGGGHRPLPRSEWIEPREHYPVRHAPPRPVQAERVLKGPCWVIDGDTIVIDKVHIRLAGIDAPELDQTCERDAKPYRCGEVARDALRQLARAELSCQVSGRDRYGRDLGTCRAAGEDVGRTLVAGGLAVAYGRYDGEEREARQAGLGLWAGRFERPADWRKAHHAIPDPSLARRG